eukprot:NODE_7_length_67686_cov_1.621421.p25 type:complete len:273 gc:universal NODE_7_length_67686_cov_1.621421:16487-17305(+)
MKPSFGDTVIVKFGLDYAAVKLEQGKRIMNRYGAFAHEDIVKLNYGMRLNGKQKHGHLLKFTPILWSKALPNRTQIIYPCDMALIISKLNIGPGSVVVESGTGSGCLSHGFLNALGKEGHLYTFEYDEIRYNEAAKEFKLHGHEGQVSSFHRDVCLNGFDLVNVADAIFLDLPSPWDCIESAKMALKEDQLGNICIFSPCIEQIQKSHEVLSQHGFTTLRTFECLLYNHSLRPVKIPDLTSSTIKEVKYSSKFTEQKSHTSFLLFGQLELCE